MDKKIASDIRLVSLNAYVRPDVKETSSKDWVLNGQYNSFYDYIIARFNGSTTNSAIIRSYNDLIYGRGLANTNTNVNDWIKFLRMFSETDIRRIVMDFEMFGEAIIQIIPANGKGKLPTCYHMPKELTAPKKKNDDGEIEGYYYSEDWKKANVDNVDYFPIVDPDKPDRKSCFPIRPYSAGKIYFSDPDYLAGLQYAELEEEISNYYLSHIMNGLSFGYIVNIPNGNSYTPEEKLEVERKIKNNLTGSNNAGRFVINFNGGDADVTVTPITVNAAHQQWNFLTGEARQQLLTAHRVTSPMLFGIKDNTGLGNNADELDTAEGQLMTRIIQPKQRYLIDAFETVASVYDLKLDLKFLPLTEEKSQVITEQKMSLSGVHPVHELISLGDNISDDYELIFAGDVDYEDTFDYELQMASTGVARTGTRSEQDSKDIFIRYRYVGNPNPEREFCKAMMNANKLYRKEDIIQMGSKTVNPGFGMSPNPNEPYSIWKFKGGGLLSDNFPGGTCKHKWQREIYLRKGLTLNPDSPLAEKISTSKARREGYKVPTNENLVSIAPHDVK